MATQFIMSHNSFGKSVSPPSGVHHPGQNKPSVRSSALKKVERLEKLERIRGQDCRRNVKNVGNGQMSLMSEVNTNDCNQSIGIGLKDLIESHDTNVVK